MNKQEKRTYTKSYFIETIKNNIFLKSHYKERERRIEFLPNGIKEMNYVLFGFKVKEDDEDIPDKCLIDDDIQER